MSTVSLSTPMKYLFGTAAAMIVIYGVRMAAGPVSMVLMAALLAQTLQPLETWLRAKRVPASASVGVTILVVLVGGVLIGTLLAASLGQLQDNLPLYRANFQALLVDGEAWLQANNMQLPQLSLLVSNNSSRIAGFVGGIGSSILSGLSNMAVVLLLMVFMLIDAGSESGGKGSPVSGFTRFSKYARQTQQYIKITSLTGFIFSVLVTIVMLIVGTDGAVTWGVLAFFLNFVPSLGMFLSVVPPVLLTMLEHGWGPAIVVLAAFLLLNFLTDNVIKPRFMKTGLDLGVLESFLALMFFSWMLGAAGTILSIPIYLTLKEILRGHVNKSGGAGGRV